ncbi:MAG: hypothetical protein ABIO72_02595 [Patescibacteria group bacterium]
MRRQLLAASLLLTLCGAGCSASADTPTIHRSWVWKILDPWGTFVEDVQVPIDFPVAVPYYENATITGIAKSTDHGKQNFVLSMSTVDNIETMDAWYRAKAAEVGWEEISISVTDELVSQAWKKGDDRLVISLIPDAVLKQTRISIVYVQILP